MAVADADALAAGGAVIGVLTTIAAATGCC
jgi:hypothetical protein